MRRSKWRKTANQHEDDDEEEDIDEHSDYAEDEEEWIRSSVDGSDQGSENKDDHEEEEQEQEKEEEQEEEQQEDLVPLGRRLRRMQSATSQACRGERAPATDSIEDEPTCQATASTGPEVQPPINWGHLVSRCSRLNLPDKQPNAAELDKDGGSNQGCSSSLRRDPGSAAWSLDGLDDAVYEIWEAQAIQNNEQAKGQA